jgi:hypothetical protein
MFLLSSNKKEEEKGGFGMINKLAFIEKQLVLLRALCMEKMSEGNKTLEERHEEFSKILKQKYGRK